MRKLLLISTLLMISVLANARKIYVSGSGSDSYTITQAQNSATPWATLSKVQSSLGSFTSGDSILFAKGGSFTGTLTIQSKTGLYFGAWGTGADPLFWGTGATIGSLVTLRGCTNVTFYGWTFSDVTIPVSDRTVQAKIQIVFTIESSTTGTVIRKCTMDRIGYGVYITATSRAQTIDSCDIGNLRMIRNTPTSVNPDDDYGGVPVQFSSRNNIFTNNYLHDCYSVSYDYGYDGGGVEFFEEGDSVINNVVMYNTFYDCNGVFEFGSNSDGVANNPQSNNVIAYNKIINSSSLIYINNNGQYKTKVTNLQCYNNVILQTVASRTGDMNMISMATADTTTGIVVIKNNIFQLSTGTDVTRSGQWTAGQLTHTNNIYKLSNGSVLNFTLGGTEISTAAVIWTKTTDSNPLNWNYELITGSPAIATGVNLGYTRDFNNQTVSNPPEIGILEYVSCSISYGTWSTCTNNVQTRTYTTSPSGCTTTPPADSILRKCGTTCIVVYSPWSGCVNGGQTRTYTVNAGCTFIPPVDSLERSCNVECISFLYGTWTACVNNIQTRNYNTIPIGCNVGTPPGDSIYRSCTLPSLSFTTTSVKRASCLNRTDGQIVISISGGVGPYYTSINSTLTYIEGKTTFSGLLPGTYIIRVKDSAGVMVSLTVIVESRRNRKC